MHRLKLLLGTSLVFLVSSSIIPFPSFVGINGFGSNTTVSTSCATALNATIGCDSSLWALALSNIYVSPNTTGMATTLCASNCNSSLVSYQNSVSVQCGSSPVINSLLKNSAVGDLLFDYYNLVCTKDPGTGKFCVGEWLSLGIFHIGKEILLTASISKIIWTQLLQLLLLYLRGTCCRAVSSVPLAKSHTFKSFKDRRS